jgi:lipopolysaccharide transport system ATP-binding protein
VTSIEVDALGKRYVVGARKPATAWWPLRWNDRAPVKHRPRREVWALRDVSFSLTPGTVLGVLGRNGAGKSTLLRILARVTPPSEGHVRGRGRVIPLLHVGGGLHPFLSGRENVFLNAAMYGVPRREVERRFGAIVDFAGLGAFIDAPLRTYSSGMHLRLAFSIAVNLEPRILLADEVLAVGDAEFQERCLESVREAARAGTTVLFVSHDMDAISRLCNRALWLDGGRVAALGAAPDVIAAYENAHVGGAGDRPQAAAPQDTKGAHAGPLGEILAVRLIDADGREIAAASPDDRVGIRIVFRADRAPIDGRCAVELHTGGICAFRSTQAEDASISAPGVHVAEVAIPGGLLATRTYSVRVRLRLAGADRQRSRLTVDPAVTFQVHDASSVGPIGRKQPGIVAPQLEWSLRRESDARET